MSAMVSSPAWVTSTSETTAPSRPARRVIEGRACTFVAMVNELLLTWNRRMGGIDVEQADGRTDVAHADAPRGDGARIGCAGSDRVTGATGLNHAAPETVVVAGRISVIRRRA